MDIFVGSGALIEKSNELLSTLSVATNQVKGIKVLADSILKAAYNGSDALANLTIFVLSCFVGYYVVWNVTPALHSPLMSVTNAVSSIIIIGALIGLGTSSGVLTLAVIFAFIAAVLAAVNIFGGFVITQRMVKMFKKKKQ